MEERGQLGVLLRARVQAHLRRDADDELDGELAVAFRFRPVGLGAKWQIDDVYVDPFRNR